MKQKQTTYVRRLHVGDRIEDDGIWIVSRVPETVDTQQVKVYLQPVPMFKGQRARAYLYDVNARVRLAA